MCFKIEANGVTPTPMASISKIQYQPLISIKSIYREPDTKSSNQFKQKRWDFPVILPAAIKIATGYSKICSAGAPYGPSI